MLLGARRLQRSELRAYRATYGWLAGRDIAHSRLAGTIHGFVLSRLERRRPSGAIQVQGRVMLLDAMDSLGLYAKGIYEPLETSIVEHLVTPGDVVLDIGAHIGY